MSAALFTASIMEMISEAADIPADKIEALKLKIGLEADKAFLLLEEMANKVTKLESDMVLSDQRISALESTVAKQGKTIKKLIDREKRVQLDKVKNSIIVKSAKSIAETTKAMVKLMETGGTEKVSPKPALVEIPPGKNAKDRALPIYRVVLKDEHKKALFKGLGLVGRDVDIRFENETPHYLAQAKRDYDKVSYTLRKAFNSGDKNRKLRTKLVLRGLKLKIMFKDVDNEDWFYIDNARAEKYLQEKVYFSKDEKPAIIPICSDFIKNILSSLD
jgi:uncharacterized coiled-coil protein SlyX